MTKEELKELIAELEGKKREAHVVPTSIDFLVLSREVSVRAVSEMKKNLRALYEAGEIETHRTLNGTSINVSPGSQPG